MAERALVLLAAGAARRFGSDKLAHPIDGEAIGVRAARIFQPFTFTRRIAVCRGAHGPVATGLSALGYTVVINPRADDGLGGSVALGAAAANGGETTAVMIALADMPFVGPAHIAALLARFDAGAALVASSAGEAACPPAIFGRAHFAALSACSADRGARELLAQATLVHATAAELRDIDRPGDLDPYAAPERA